MNKREIGDGVDRLDEDVRAAVRDLLAQYRAHRLPELLKQAVDAPRRARTQLAAWLASYDKRNGSGAAQFLNACLVAAGSSRTIAQVDAALAALDAQMQPLVTGVLSQKWTADELAAALELAAQPDGAEEFVYDKLPIPDDYVTVWSERWIKQRSGEKDEGEIRNDVVLRV